MNKTVLIIEDDPDIQDYYKIILAGLNLNLLRAENGREALEIIDSEQKIDLIILDIVMPEMNGEDFLRKIRNEKKSKIPIIISTVDEFAASKISDIAKVDGVFLKLDSNSKLIKLINDLIM